MRTQWCLADLALLCFIDLSAVMAQPEQVHCEKLRPIVGAYGYRLRDSDVRCEGIYESQISSTELEIVSVTLGGIRYNLGTERLAIFVPEFTGYSIDSVRITAVGIPPRTYYRMDARLSRGKKLIWPLGVVVRPSGLTNEQLGVYGWIVREREQIMIPLAVGPADAALPNARAGVEIKLRTGVGLVDLLWRIAEEGGAVSQWRPIVEGEIGEGDAVHFRLPDGPAGVLALEFVGRNPHTGTWINLKAKVLRPPP